MTTVSPLVLVVDDDPSVRKSLTRLLASADYTVEAFASAREFLARPPHAGPCCLVLDVRMPGLTGIQLQELLAATGRRMSIVFVSGHVDVKTSVKAMKAGAVDLLTKPVDAHDLIAAIQRAVTRDEHDRAAEARRAEVQRRPASSIHKAGSCRLASSAPSAIPLSTTDSRRASAAGSMGGPTAISTSAPSKLGLTTAETRDLIEYLKSL
jgi:FixJ family two-component response regulator